MVGRNRLAASLLVVAVLSAGFSFGATPRPAAPSGFAENFDGVTAPALPAGWVASTVPSEGPQWRTATCQGIFPDVPCSGAFAPWIEDLYTRQIAAGCGNGDFCPGNPTTRGQMAPFLVKMFGLRLYGN